MVRRSCTAGCGSTAWHNPVGMSAATQPNDRAALNHNSSQKCAATFIYYTFVSLGPRVGTGTTGVGAGTTMEAGAVAGAACIGSRS